MTDYGLCIISSMEFFKYPAKHLRFYPEIYIKTPSF
jgi:hypothetical protein